MKLRFCLMLLATVLGCSEGVSNEPVGFSAAWLTPAGTIPEEVVSIQVAQIVSQTEEIGLFGRSVPVIMDEDMNGRRELLVPNLPTGQVFELEVRGLDASENKAYIGRSGPLRLETGQRQYIDVAMYPIGASTTVDRGDPLPPRAMHTATALDDGRVLISGGFTTVGTAACPGGLPGVASCFAMTASANAYIYDPPTARFWPVQGGMLAARGGHTATLLGDGRVLIAGGAPQAVLAIARVGPAMNSREIFFFPEDTHASFEVFEPDANFELEDVDGDGDPGRGGFVGDLGGSTPGPLNSPRFLHAAAQTPDNAQRVLLAGGIGGERSYEVFDIDKPGGSGVYAAPSGTLTTPRSLPSAIALSAGSPRVWIVGGGSVVTNEDLADVWEPSDSDPNGTIIPASSVDGTAFPNLMAGEGDLHPEWALLRPVVASFDGMFGFVSGWYGPRCPLDMFAGAPVVDVGPTSICNQMGGSSIPRSYTFDNTTGVTMPTAPPDGAKHAFGEAVTLGDGRVIVVGGVASELLQPNLRTVVYSGVSGGAATGLSGVSIVDGRFFGASAAIFDTGVLVTGGLSLSSLGDTLTLVPPSKALVLNYPNREQIRPGT